MKMLSNEGTSQLAAIPGTLPVIYIYTNIARLRKSFLLPSSGKRPDKLSGPLEIVSTSSEPKIMEANFHAILTSTLDECKK
jgi:hypothetical protein